MAWRGRASAGEHRAWANSGASSPRLDGDGNNEDLHAGRRRTGKRDRRRAHRGRPRVWLVNAWQDHVDAMNARGLILRDGSDRTVRVRAQTTCDGIGPVDLVVVLVKSYHTEEAVRSAAAAGVVGPLTVVMSMQNGLGHEDVIAGIVGRERTMAGKTYTGGVVLAPGHVIAGTRGKESIVGELDGQMSDRARRIADAFSAAGLATTVSDNIVGAMWDKLFINVATGALAGITRLTYGDLYQVPAIEACALGAVSEAMAVARALRVRIATTKPEEAWVHASAGLPPEFKTSMLQSLEKGLTDRDRLHQRFSRARGRALRRPYAGQPDARRLREGRRSRHAGCRGTSGTGSPSDEDDPQGHHRLRRRHRGQERTGIRQGHELGAGRGHAAGRRARRRLRPAPRCRALARRRRRDPPRGRHRRGLRRDAAGYAPRLRRALRRRRQAGAGGEADGTRSRRVQGDDRCLPRRAYRCGSPTTGARCRASSRCAISSATARSATSGW